MVMTMIPRSSHQASHESADTVRSLPNVHMAAEGMMLKNVYGGNPTGAVAAGPNGNDFVVPAKQKGASPKNKLRKKLGKVLRSTGNSFKGLPHMGIINGGTSSVASTHVNSYVPRVSEESGRSGSPAGGGGSGIHLPSDVPLWSINHMAPTPPPPDGGADVAPAEADADGRRPSRVPDSNSSSLVSAVSASSAPSDGKGGKDKGGGGGAAQHVRHDYTDYADLPDEEQALPPEVDADNSLRKRNTGGVITPFPERLHQMLTLNQHPEIVSWAPHGRCFLVRHPREFETTVMSQHFNHTKITSFQRQLNLYGFKRITRGVDRGAYYHELFLRGRPKLCTRMRRQKVKGTGHKPLPDPDNEPNFYAMTSVSEYPAGVSPEDHEHQQLNSGSMPPPARVESAVSSGSPAPEQDGVSFPLGGETNQESNFPRSYLAQLRRSNQGSLPLPLPHQRHNSLPVKPQGLLQQQQQQGQARNYSPNNSLTTAMGKMRMTNPSLVNSANSEDIAAAAANFLAQHPDEAQAVAEGVGGLAPQSLGRHHSAPAAAHSYGGGGAAPAPAAPVPSGAVTSAPVPSHALSGQTALRSDISDFPGVAMTTDEGLEAQEVLSSEAAQPPRAQSRRKSGIVVGISSISKKLFSRRSSVKRMPSGDYSAAAASAGGSVDAPAVTTSSSNVDRSMGSHSRRRGRRKSISSVEMGGASIEMGSACRRLSQTRLSITSIGSFGRRMSLTSIGVNAGPNGRRLSIMSWDSCGSLDAGDIERFESKFGIGKDPFREHLAATRESMSASNVQRALSTTGSEEWIEDQVHRKRHSLNAHIDFDGIFDEDIGGPILDGDAASV